MRFDDDDEVCAEDSDELDAAMLREELVAELESINQYQEHTEMLNDEDAQSVVRRHLSEEKEHVAALVKLILRLDPGQAEKFEKMGLDAPHD